MTANPQLWWEPARATGIAAWALSGLSVLGGLLLSGRAVRGTPTPVWRSDLHRAYGGLTVAFVVAHCGALVADTCVHFGPADLFVPFASRWKPGPVAWGIVALYLLVAVEVTFLRARGSAGGSPVPARRLRPGTVTPGRGEGTGECCTQNGRSLPSSTSTRRAGSRSGATC